MMTDAKKTLKRTLKPAGCVTLHEGNSYASFFRRVQSLASAHCLPSTSGERGEIRHAMIQMKKKAKNEQSFSFTINAKALCISEKSIFPLVLHCTNGKGICISKWMLPWCSERESEGEAYTTCCLCYAEWLFLIVVCFLQTYFPPKTSRGRIESCWGWVNSHPGKSPSMER